MKSDNVKRFGLTVKQIKQICKEKHGHYPKYGMESFIGNYWDKDNYHGYVYLINWAGSLYARVYFSVNENWGKLK
jgi:hypothetical protein